MKTPKAFGWFHLLGLIIMSTSIAFLYNKKKHGCKVRVEAVLSSYGIAAFALELTKQIIWALNYNFVTDVAVWDYQWYAAPFQLCTTPIYACLISFFLDEKSELRKSLLSYVAFITILGSIATIIMPESCFTEDIVVNIHTMFIHYGSFVVSVYLMVSGEVELNTENLRRALVVFAIFIGIAMMLNIGVYQSDILNGETFNMFYISPYFISELPVFNTIQQSVPYPIFLATYFVALSIGAAIILNAARGVRWLSKTNRNTIFGEELHAKI